MQFMVISLLVLAICELPVLQAKKVVVVMPRQVRRTPSSPWRHLALMHAKRYAHGIHGYPGQKPGYGNHGIHYYRPKDLRFTKDQYPQGGDDFDQGHEEVNHVMVPHGKGISHAISFGKGYIPFESYKDHRATISHHHDYKNNVPAAQDIQYSPTMNNPSGVNYAQGYITQHADSYLANAGGGNKEEFQDRIQDQGSQKYPNSKSQYDAAIGPIAGSYGGGNIQTGKHNLYLNQGIPNNANQGFVLRDSVNLDDYHRKVEELTKNWSANFISNNFSPGTQNANVGHQQGPLQPFGLSRQFDDNNALHGFPRITNFASNSNNHRGQSGYAVKEDVIDTPHDFRTMPIQTAPPVSGPQQTPLLNVQQIQQPVRQIFPQQQLQQQIVHQQPVQQSLQHVFPQTQIPLSYPTQSYQDFLHG